jgi:hypothetical protein
MHATRPEHLIFDLITLRRVQITKLLIMWCSRVTSPPVGPIWCPFSLPWLVPYDTSTSKVLPEAHPLSAAATGPHRQVTYKQLASGSESFIFICSVSHAFKRTRGFAPFGNVHRFTHRQSVMTSSTDVEDKWQVIHHGLYELWKLFLLRSAMFIKNENL